MDEHLFDTRGVGRRDAALPAGVPAELAARVAPTSLARERRLEVLDALEPLLPDGLRRGSTLAVRGVGATSLALATAAGPSAAGSWVATVGFGSLGLVAADEYGVDLSRFAMIATPEPSAWATVVAALVDAFEVVLVRTTHRVGARDARRLMARARERGAVLLQVGGTDWPEQPETILEVIAADWEGLGVGHGHLRARRVTVAATGRREAARRRRVDLWLPAEGGGVAVAQPPTLTAVS